MWLLIASELQPIFDYADRLGVVAMLIVIILGGFRGWWVWGRDYKKMEQEKNDWRNLALSGTELADRLSRQQVSKPFGE